MEVPCNSCQILVKNPCDTLDLEITTKLLCNDCQLKSQDTFSSIQRTPIKCPVTKCGSLMCITDIFKHFMNEECVTVDFCFIQEDSEIELAFNSGSLPIDEIYCIGGLLYGSSDKMLSLPNNIPNIRYEQYKNHLPILIMAAKTDMANLFSLKTKTNDELIVFWLVSPQTLKPVFGEILVQKRKYAKGGMIMVKDVRQETDLATFLSEDSNYLYLTPGEIKNLSNREGKVQLKIKIVVSYDK